MRFFDDLVKRFFILRLVRKRFKSLDRTAFHGRTSLGIAEFGFRLPLELHVLHFDGKHGGQSFAEVVAEEIRLFFFEQLVVARIVVEHARQPSAESHFVESPLGRGYVIDEREQILAVLFGVLHGKFDENPVAFARIIERFGIERRLVRIEITCKIGNTALITVGHGIGLGCAHEIELHGVVVAAARLELVLRDALVGQRDRKPLVEEGKFL